jgi:hypothetical protein
MVKMSRDWKLQRRTIHSPDWDEDESVVIRSYFGDHDRQRVLSASTEYRRDEQTGDMTIVATLDKLHATKRKLAVVSWTLKDADGHPLPFNEDNLLNLPHYVAEFIDTEINKDWDNLGEPVASKEEAERQEQQEKTDRATFLGPGLSSAERPDANGRADDGAGEDDSGKRRAQAAGT